MRSVNNPGPPQSPFLWPILIGGLLPLAVLLWGCRRELLAVLLKKPAPKPPSAHKSRSSVTLPSAEETAASVARFKAVSAKFVMLESALDIINAARASKRKHRRTE